MTADGSRPDDPFFMLRQEARSCREFEDILSSARERRDRLALRLVSEGFTWREVAAAAGFANPYITHLKKKYEAVPRDC